MPERGQGSPVPAGTVRQDAGAQMLNKLTEKLDQEITRAGGNLGGFTNASQAHTMSQGIPLPDRERRSGHPGGTLPEQCSGEDVRHLRDQCGDHHQPVYGLLSRLPLCSDRRS
ncbi:MAG: hypothetical protein MPW15_24205 [Candidatus Manganitrophus sp.]|nr:hypothetical protein [Candidatus Manganitrophus sp.]